MRGNRLSTVLCHTTPKYTVRNPLSFFSETRGAAVEQISDGCPPARGAQI